jgi:nucleoside-diphosphate-sugar epimerase
VVQFDFNYGVSKLNAEHLTLFHAREDKLKPCSLILYSVYGPRERPDKLYLKFIEVAFNDTSFTLSAGGATHLRSFIFADDILDGVVLVIDNENQVNKEVLNLGTEIKFTAQQRIDLVEKLTGKKINVVVVLKRARDQLRAQAVINKAKKVLAYNPKTTLEEGIKKHINWYLKSR